MVKDATVALGLVVWNGERYINSLIESLLEQTYQDYKLYVLDNQSTDRTIDILNSYKSLGSRIEIHIDTEPRGFIDAQKIIFDKYLSKHKYCVFLCDDDVYDTNFLKKNVFEIERGNSLLSYSNFNYIDDFGNIIIPRGLNPIYKGKSKWHAYKFLIARNCIPIFFGVYDSAKLRKHFMHFRRFNKDGYNHENLMLFSILLNSKVSYIEDVLFSYRIKDRKLIYSERGYPDTNSIIQQLYKDIVHNFAFIKECFHIYDLNHGVDINRVVLNMVSIISLVKYTVYVFLKRFINAFKN